MRKGVLTLHLIVMPRALLMSALTTAMQLWIRDSGFDELVALPDLSAAARALTKKDVVVIDSLSSFPDCIIESHRLMEEIKRKGGTLVLLEPGSATDISTPHGQFVISQRLAVRRCDFEMAAGRGRPG
jgi:DNA invertase Pin-like site-specific DNA recombinase